MLEHILASNIDKHLDGQGILYDLQHGFREKWSCETQLIMLIEDLARKCGKQRGIILLDFSKAFDKVNHRNDITTLDFNRQLCNSNWGPGWVTTLFLGKPQ